MFWLCCSFHIKIVSKSLLQISMYAIIHGKSLNLTGEVPLPVLIRVWVNNILVSESLLSWLLKNLLNHFFGFYTICDNLCRTVDHFEIFLKSTNLSFYVETQALKPIILYIIGCNIIRSKFYNMNNTII